MAEPLEVQEKKEPPLSYRSLYHCEVLQGKSLQPYKRNCLLLADEEELPVFSNTIHSTSVNLLQECPRKFFYVERLRLQPKGGSADALWIGGIFHKVIEKMAKGSDIQEAKEAVAADVAAEIDRVNEEADNLGLLPGGKSAASVIGRLDKDATLGLVMADYVFRHYPWPRKDDWEVMGVELPIQMKWATLVSPISATIDLLLYDKEENELWIVDHKTTSKDLLTEAQRYKLSVQPRIYRACVESILSSGQLVRNGSPVKAPLVGVVHQLVAKPSIRQRQSETFEDFVERVAAWYRAGTQEKPTFLRSWVRFTGDVMPPDLLLRLREASAAETCDPDLAKFFVNDKACDNWNRTCPYLPLCTEEPKNWGPIIETFYERSHRDADIDGR